MNLIVGIVVGGLIGWIAFSLLNANRDRGLRASLFIGLVGGVLGVQLAPMLSPSAGGGGDSQFNLFYLVMSVASAAACLTVANIIARRGGA